MGLPRLLLNTASLARNEHRSPSAIRALQHTKLARLLNFARHHSRFYAEHLSGVRIESAAPEIRDVPPLTKEMVIARYDDVLTHREIRHRDVVHFARSGRAGRERLWGRFVVLHTSGTTGVPFHSVFDDREWDFFQALGLRGYFRIGFGPRESAGHILRFAILRRETFRTAVICARGGPYVTRGLFSLVPGAVGRLNDLHLVSVLESTRKIVAKLNRIRPHMVHSYPSLLETLALEQGAGRLKIRPILLTSASEPAGRSVRDAVLRAWGNVLFETYGSSECPLVAGECGRHTGLHVAEDAYVVENVDDSGRPVPPGEFGHHLLITSLESRTMPLIRYECPDVARIVATPCDCGSPFVRIEVKGRSDDVIRVRSGRDEEILLSPIALEALMLETGGIRRFQICQESPRRMSVLYDPDPGADAADVHRRLRSGWKSYLADRGLSGRLTIQFRRTADFKRTAAGKVRQIYSKIRPTKEDE